HPGCAAAGMETFPKWALLEGALFQVSNFGKAPQPTNPISGGEALLYTAGDQTAKFIITRDANLDTMKFDPMQWKDRIATVAAIMDVSDVSLDKLRANGRNINMTDCTRDTCIS